MDPTFQRDVMEEVLQPSPLTLTASPPPDPLLQNSRHTKNFPQKESNDSNSIVHVTVEESTHKSHGSTEPPRTFATSIPFGSVLTSSHPQETPTPNTRNTNTSVPSKKDPSSDDDANATISSFLNLNQTYINQISDMLTSTTKNTPTQEKPSKPKTNFLQTVDLRDFLSAPTTKEPAYPNGNPFMPANTTAFHQNTQPHPSFQVPQGSSLPSSQQAPSAPNPPVCNVHPFPTNAPTTQVPQSSRAQPAVPPTAPCHHHPVQQKVPHTSAARPVPFNNSAPVNSTNTNVHQGLSSRPTDSSGLPSPHHVSCHPLHNTTTQAQFQQQQQTQQAPLPFNTYCARFNISTWKKETKDVTLASEDFDAVEVFYQILRQCLSSSTTIEVLPPLDNLYPTYEFYDELVTSNLLCTPQAYDTMSNNLRIFLRMPNTISSSCTMLQRRIIQCRKIQDGLLFFKELLAGIFPHLGALRSTLKDELQTLRFNKGDTLWDIQHRVENLETRLGYSSQPIHPTLVIEHYLKELVKIPSIQHVVGPIFRDFQVHLRTHGANTPFATSIQDIYTIIKEYGISEDQILINITPELPESSLSPDNPHASTPSIHQTIIPVDDTTKSRTQHPNYSSSKSPSRRSQSPRRRSVRFQCDICFGPHKTNKCYLRGDTFCPKWLLRNRVKYIAQNPDAKPDSAVINSAPPLRSPRRPVVYNLLQDPDDEGYSTAKEDESTSISSSPIDTTFVNDFPVISNTVIPQSSPDDPFSFVDA